MSQTVLSKEKRGKLQAGKARLRPTEVDTKPCVDLIKSDDSASTKADAPESPTSRLQLKSLSTELKDLEKLGFDPAFEATLRKLPSLSTRYHWKVFLELADLAKRMNRVTETRVLFAVCGFLCPQAHQVWLEYSKLEEECGRLQTSRLLLRTGLLYSPLSDQLSIKLLKTEERLHHSSAVRGLLSTYQSYPLDSTWKVLLEGAIFEARCGNVCEARAVFQFLMSSCGHFGAVFIEAVKFEEKWGADVDAALEYCERGLGRNCRYGPLWFAYLKAIEKAESEVEREGKKKSKFSLSELCEKRRIAVSSAVEALSKELSWKVYLEYSLTLEKRGNLDECRKYLREAVLTSPDNLRWKALVVAARIELKSNRPQAAGLLLEKSLMEVPAKQRSLVLAEEAKMYEFLGDMDRAEKTIQLACEEAKQDWKIYLEAITMYMRAREFESAMNTAKQALLLYSCTGRLWAVLVQLQHTSKSLIDSNAPMDSFIQALQEVPKSGEVWCEGARLRLNPFSPYFDLSKAEEYLRYAIQFTPQYGDSFIELMRLYYLTSQQEKLSELKQDCINADPNYGMLWFFCKKTALDTPRDIWKTAKRLVLEDLATFGVFYFNRTQRDDLVEKMWAGLSHVWRVYEDRELLTAAARWKLIYGNELLTV